ncbi:hypothetical protein GQ44DRAFT_705103 [Phaeosphaeriaceae sp. PMI808]|nr:hypothetical protein GQ44DRAFT_705103 [Phaeosphaeriaceae sp. PMI808]
MSMAEMGKHLSLELTRVIESPYPASLSHLADILTRADVVTVRACIHDLPPCAVSRLAKLVSEALPLWAYALCILSSLCSSPEFRDTLLLQNPSLLDALVTKANSSPQDFDNYAALCVVLLSRPLPVSLALPASAQSFFVYVFEKAKEAPDVNTLKPVYSMLKGACRNLFSLLPLHSQQLFDQGLSHILSSSGAGQASMLLLWCFGIVLLAEYPDAMSHLQDSQSSTDQPTTSPEKVWKTASGHKMFGSANRLHKTISLTTLSVIWATKGDVGISDEDAIEGIRIAVHTLRFMEQTTIDSWLKSSTRAMETFKKLPSKISRENINPAVQLQALCFYAMIAGHRNLLLEVVTQYESCLRNIAGLIDSDCLGEALSISLPLFSEKLQQSSIQILLASILEACISSVNSRQLSNFVTLVERITAILPCHNSLQATVVSALSSNGMQTKLWDFVLVKSETGHAPCRAHLFTLHQQLSTAMVTLLLTLALTTHFGQPALPLAMTTALVSKRRQVLPLASQCTHITCRPEPGVISLFQQQSTPYGGQHLQDWRCSLQLELESQGFYQRDSIIRSVAQICQDLETRCDIVEEPLRREKERSKDLEQQLMEANQRVISLETQAADDRFHMEGLDDEKAHILEQRDKFSAKIKVLEAEAHAVILRAKENFNSKELELQSTILAHEESLHAHKLNGEAQNGTIIRLREELQHVQDQQILLNEQRDTLHHQLNAAEQKLNKETTTTRQQHEELTQIKNRNMGLEPKLQGTKDELEAVTAKLGNLQVDHQKLIHSSHVAYRDLELKYALDMEAAKFKFKGDLENLATQLEDSKQLGQREEDAHNETKRDLHLLQTSLPPLEAKIQELTDHCSEQQDELEELANWRRNVFISMGLQSQFSMKKRTSSRAPKGATNSETPQVPQEHLPRKRAAHSLENTQEISENTQRSIATTMEGIADATLASSTSPSSQGGSTPKRPKPRRSPKISATQTPYTQNSMVESRIVSIPKRPSSSKYSALGQLAPNRRHTTVGFTVVGGEEAHPNESHSARKTYDSLQGVVETDLGMTDFEADAPLTPGNFLVGTGRFPDVDDDDQTAEL